MGETPLERYSRRHREIEERGKGYGVEISRAFLRISQELEEDKVNCEHEFQDCPYKDALGNTIGTFLKCSLCAYEEPVSRGRFRDGRTVG